MRICVFGLWHLGGVTAACVADAGFDTVGIDENAVVVAGLLQGRAPLFEPGLDELLKKGLASKRLTFTADLSAAQSADIVWITIDTPVDDDDNADAASVMRRVEQLLPHVGDGAIVLVSSQLPAGSIAQLEAGLAQMRPRAGVVFACSPENLRLGRAIQAFRGQDRIVVGIRSGRGRELLGELLGKLCSKILWMSVESAEMTKHAVNAFLAASVTFANELAAVCERVGADADEVEAAMRAEPRIGAKAYIRPGAAFAGGTLARDVGYLSAFGRRHSIRLPLLDGILPSNQSHRAWAFRTLCDIFGSLAGRKIGVLGLAYKPDTDAIRRSIAIELCRAIRAAGGTVQAHDPRVRLVPEDLADAVTLVELPADAARGADALVVATDWADYRALSPDTMLGGRSARIVVLDPNRALDPRFRSDPRIQYLTVGVRR